MTTIGLSYSLVKISTKCAPALLEVVWCFCLPDRVDQAIEKVGSLYDSPTFPCINTVTANDYPSSGGDCQPCIEKTDYHIPAKLMPATSS